MTRTFDKETNFKPASLLTYTKQKLAYLKHDIARRIRVFRNYKLLEYNQIALSGTKIALEAYISQNVRNAIFSGVYEAAELRIVKAKLSADDIVMEIGAGLGLVSAFCAKKIGSDRVFAYEANPLLEPLIRNNYSLNNVCPTLNICMLDNAVGEQILYIHEDFWSSSMRQSLRKSLFRLNLLMKKYGE
jgi:tRNA G37 N-methylase Trm5